MELTIIIPACNEESRLGPTLERYISYFSQIYGRRWELLVVVNGSTDRTIDVANECITTDNQVYSMEFSQKLGKGGAILKGLAHSRGDIVAWVDADNMVSPEQTHKLIAALTSHDLAIGWRQKQLSLSRNPHPIARRLASATLHLWVWLYLGLKFHDTQCGAKAVRKSALTHLTRTVVEHGWAFDLDLLAAAEQQRLQTVEIPVTWNHHNTGSKVRLFSAGWEVFLATIRIRSRYWSRHQ